MLQQTNKGIVISIKINPKAARSEIVGWENEELKIRISAVPEKGEANAELIRYLSRFFSIGKSNIELLQGQTSRHKIICLKGIALEKVEEILREHSC